ncbi:nuclease-related domain-containing protein [Cytobacillus sp. NCCP-133]|uniref:nuclease-related domain-containing protein n=1 Tax=Cytobacillus sp. NCCP-133 TaxID=766848 RepID=UPI00223233D8|nr:nuclease-related domain-containing protein [Cytobacillus sp. NCCP-133]GLB59781.1 nuclease [Cytobacillus sp. NCCP-133]
MARINFVKGMMPVILKKRKSSDFIQSMEVLLRRLPGTHSKKTLIENDLAKRKAGFRGEEAVDYFIKDSKEITIVHDIRLSNGAEFFQIDTMLISSNFILILEIKNISGTIYFDPTFNQLIQTRQENERGFLDPLIQAKRQQRELIKWLHAVKISIPVEYLIVISNPSTVIKTASYHREALNKVLHASHLIERIERLKEKYPEETLSHKEIRKLSKTIVNKHIPANYNVLKYYDIHEKEIITGIPCPACSRLPMKRVRGTWKCVSCSTTDKKAHVRALQDYLHLISSSITNHQFREFTHLPSSNIAKKLLTGMELPCSGLFKDRTYHLSADFFEKYNFTGQK